MTKPKTFTREELHADTSRVLDAVSADGAAIVLGDDGEPTMTVSRGFVLAEEWQDHAEMFERKARMWRDRAEIAERQLTRALEANRETERRAIDAEARVRDLEAKLTAIANSKDIT